MSFVVLIQLATLITFQSAAVAWPDELPNVRHSKGLAAVDSLMVSADSKLEGIQRTLCNSHGIQLHPALCQQSHAKPFCHSGMGASVGHEEHHPARSRPHFSQSPQLQCIESCSKEWSPADHLLNYNDCIQERCRSYQASGRRLVRRSGFQLSTSRHPHGSRLAEGSHLSSHNQRAVDTLQSCIEVSCAGQNNYGQCIHDRCVVPLGVAGRRRQLKQQGGNPHQHKQETVGADGDEEGLVFGDDIRRERKSWFDPSMSCIDYHCDGISRRSSHYNNCIERHCARLFR